MNKSFRAAELNDLIHLKDPIQKNRSDISTNTQKSAIEQIILFIYYYLLVLFLIDLLILVCFLTKQKDCMVSLWDFEYKVYELF